jgi:hypothetical protein
MPEPGRWRGAGPPDPEPPEPDEAALPWSGPAPADACPDCGGPVDVSYDLVSDWAGHTNRVLSTVRCSRDCRGSMPPTPRTPEEAAEVAGYVPRPGDLLVTGGRAWTVTEDGWVNIGEVTSVTITGGPGNLGDSHREYVHFEAPPSIRDRLQAVEGVLDEAAEWEASWESRAHRWQPHPAAAAQAQARLLAEAVEAEERALAEERAERQEDDPPDRP